MSFREKIILDLRNCEDALYAIRKVIESDITKDDKIMYKKFNQIEEEIEHYIMSLESCLDDYEM